MAASRTSLLVRFAVRSLGLAVQYWPESSRHWGQAVLAEMGEITEPAAAFSWAAGGILVFFRAVLSDLLAWLKLPAGGRLSNASLRDGNGGPQLPRNSRLVTALVLLAGVALFFLPVGQEARRTVGASWQEFGSFRGDERELERLGTKAEREKDARELAFVALSLSSDRDRAYFADRAVAIDPSLTWIYATHFRRLDDRADGERLAMLKKFDPDNAVVHLEAAVAEATPIHRSVRGGQDKTVKALTSDSKWLNEMDRAFDVPRYDSYRNRSREIVREGWERKPALSPSVAAIDFYLDFFPSIFEIHAYIDLRIREARQAATDGHMGEAEKIVQKVTAFGERVSKETDASEFQQWIGLDLTRRGLRGLRQIYADAGRGEEAEATALQIRGIEAKTEKLKEDIRRYHKEDWRASQKRAALVQVSSAVAALLAGAILLSLCVLELSSFLSRRQTGIWRSVACRIADYGPVLFLAATITFLISFEPFATALQKYRSAGLPRIELRQASMELGTLQDVYPLSYFSPASGEYFLWMVITIVLSAIGIVVLVHGLMRRKAVPSAMQ